MFNLVFQIADYAMKAIVAFSQTDEGAKEWNEIREAAGMSRTDETRRRVPITQEMPAYQDQAQSATTSTTSSASRDISDNRSRFD